MSLASRGMLAVAGCAAHVEGGGAGGSGDGGSPATQGGGGSASTDGDLPPGCVTVEGACRPGDVQTCGACLDEGGSELCGTQSCAYEIGDFGVCRASWDTCVPANTPLVLAFDGAPVELVADASHGFTLAAGQSLVTDWPTARTPWLALDRDGSGAIDDGAELFGSMTALAGGRRATNGFEALAALDANGDGVIDARDPAFVSLVVWADVDGDRRSSPRELTSLASRGVESIELAYTSHPRCDARGNCEVERAAFTYVDETGARHRGAVIDLHLAAR
ncbi:MAG TPA: calcium-binding protein [Minicystis sp.]|nr:calcium-binding protein [Minicystis sp.]